MLRHCLTVDVEAFAEGMAESFPVPQEFLAEPRQDSEVERNTNVILEQFAQRGWQATFFVLGRVGERLPQLVRRITEAGHEIASHSFWHRRIFGQSRQEFRSDLRRGKDALEQASGNRIIGFRAPDFSIRTDNWWALDEILEAGFRYDTSLNPTDVHDVYGVPLKSHYIHRLENGLWEFPAATFRIAGKIVPYAGGGYLRLYPIWLTRRLVRRAARIGQATMFYIHPYELGPEIPTIPGLSPLRKLRHYCRVRNGMTRFAEILSGVSVAPVRTLLEAEGMKHD